MNFWQKIFSKKENTEKNNSVEEIKTENGTVEINPTSTENVKEEVKEETVETKNENENLNKTVAIVSAICDNETSNESSETSEDPLKEVHDIIEENNVSIATVEPNVVEPITENYEDEDFEFLPTRDSDFVLPTFTEESGVINETF
jgi:dynactin complex subunit